MLLVETVWFDIANCLHYNSVDGKPVESFVLGEHGESPEHQRTIIVPHFFFDKYGRVIPFREEDNIKHACIRARCLEKIIRDISDAMEGTVYVCRLIQDIKRVGVVVNQYSRFLRVLTKKEHDFLQREMNHTTEVNLPPVMGIGVT